MTTELERLFQMSRIAGPDDPIYQQAEVIFTSIRRPTNMQDCIVGEGVAMEKPVFTIMPDYGGAYGWTAFDDGSDTGGGSCHADVGGWVGILPISDSLHAKFSEWQGQFEQTGGWTDEALAKFDWVEFHQQGLAQTIRLKGEMQDSAIVIYEKPYEDPTRAENQRVEILLGGEIRKLPSRAELALLIPPDEK